MRLLLKLMLLLPSTALAQLVDVGSCPAGQSISPNTSGHCCWQGQVWSADGRCAGIPVCPAGAVAQGEGCVAVAPAKTDAPKLEAAGSDEDLPKAPISFRLSGGILLGSWFGAQLGLQVQIPLWQPLRGRHVSGWLFVQPEASVLYFSESAGLNLYRYTLGGIVALTAGWNQRLSIFSIVPRIGPALVVGHQWGDVPDSNTAQIVGLAGIDFYLHLGRFVLNLGGDFLFNSSKNVWLTRIGFGF